MSTKHHQSPNHRLLEDDVRKELELQRFISEALKVHAESTRSMLDDPDATIPAELRGSPETRGTLEWQARVLADAHEVMAERAAQAEKVFNGDYESLVEIISVPPP